jgi:uncharacterized protein YegP (UPF0339 family)
MAKFDIYKDRTGNYRWRLIARNGQKVATSGELRLASECEACG